MKEIIRKLVEVFGPSGHEEQVRNLIEEMIKDYVDEMKVDRMGNLIALKKGTKSKNKIMVVAHMDEIGCMVSHIDKKGFARIASIGGVNPINKVGGRIKFENGSVGVIGMEKPKTAGTRPELNEFYVDLGATSFENCPVKVGDAGCFLQNMEEAGNSLISKAMDDRIGCAIMVQTIKKMKHSSADIYYVFSAQEEVGTRGAGPSAYAIDPDVGIALDVTLTGDTPESSVQMSVSLGEGPAIKVKDSGMLTTPWVKEWMINVAEKNKIKYQMEVLTGGSTDARAVQLTRAGIPAGCISVPARYVHSPSEMVNYQDVLDSVLLLVKMLEKPVFK